MCIPRNKYKKVTFIHACMKYDPGIVLGAKFCLAVNKTGKGPALWLVRKVERQ